MGAALSMRWKRSRQQRKHCYTALRDRNDRYVWKAVIDEQANRLEQLRQVQMYHSHGGRRVQTTGGLDKPGPEIIARQEVILDDLRAKFAASSYPGRYSRLM